MHSPPLIAAYKGEAGPDVLMLGKVWSQASGRPLRVVTIYPGPAPISMGRVDALSGVGQPRGGKRAPGRGAWPAQGVRRRVRRRPVRFGSPRAARRTGASRARLDPDPWLA